MNFEYKAIHTKGIIEVDESNGILTAIVAVTGIEDNVKDIIEPGAFTKTLEKRTPKGIWSHDWKIPVSKTIEAKELMPGDPELPEKLANGQPWPKEAGGLKVKTQFNLNTNEGRSAYENVIFFDDDQEWSIGYQVPAGSATRDAKGVRRIKSMELYEYSPVLFGAMSNARSVKELAHEQLMSVKSILGDDAFRDEIESLVDEGEDEQKSGDAEIETKLGLPEGSIKALLEQQSMIDDVLEKVAKASGNPDEDDDFDDLDDAWGLDDEYEEEEDEDEEEEKSLAEIFNSLETKGYNTMQIRQAIGSMNVAALSGDVAATAENADAALSIIESDITSNDSYQVDLADLAQIVGRTTSDLQNRFEYDEDGDNLGDFDSEEQEEEFAVLPIADDADDLDDDEWEEWEEEEFAVLPVSDDDGGDEYDDADEEVEPEDSSEEKTLFFDTLHIDTKSVFNNGFTQL